MKQPVWNYTKNTQELIDIFSEDPVIRAMKRELKDIDNDHDTVIVFKCSDIRRRIGKIQEIDKWFDFEPPKAA